MSKCQDTNGTPGIQTSVDANALAWGQEECVAWHTPIPHGDNRPVAWTNGTFNDQTCEYEDLHVWTAWSDGAPGTAVVALLDGDTGTILQEVPIPDLPQPWPGWFGFYGAAVDAEDNVWLSQLQGSNPQQAWLVKVDRDTFTYTGYPVPGDGGYGMTVTNDGYVWLCGLQTRRFNPQTQNWTSVPLLAAGVHTGGCMGDGEGLLYRGSYAQVHGIDTTTLEVVRTLDVGQVGDGPIWGVAVDFDGFVWGVPINGSRAYKVDPDTNTISLQVDGLVQAYTYSDMTGFALQNVNPG
jgi:streptogramin lyase